MRNSNMGAVKAVLLVLTLALAGCGAAERPPRVDIEAKLRRHLTDQSLSVRWVRCIAGPSPTYRCNVDFGDLHIEIYCAAVVEGKLHAAEWRVARHGVQNRAAAARECARRIGAVG
jgi:hypothetical protein